MTGPAVGGSASPGTTTRPLEILRHHALPLLVLSVFTLVVLAPLYPPGTWSTHLHSADAWSSCYATNWGQHVLWTRPWDYYRMAIFHPQPFPRFFTDVNPFMALLTAPLRLAGSPVLAYNGMMLLTMVLVGAAFYGTAWLFTRNRRASLLGAVVFSCNGDQLYHAFGHPNIICPLFLPISVYLAIQIDREKRWKHALLLAVCLFLQYPCSFYHGVILMAGIGTVWMALLAGRRMRPGRADLLFAGAFALAMAGAYPLSAPFRELGERMGQGRSLHEAALYSADPVGYLVPSFAGWSSQTFLGKWLVGTMPYTQRLENTQFFGYFPWIITCLALIETVRRHRKGTSEPNDRLLLLLIPVAFLGFLLSLGPFLWLGPKLTGIRLPFLAIFEWIPPSDSSVSLPDSPSWWGCWWPSRWPFSWGDRQPSTGAPEPAARASARSHWPSCSSNIFPSRGSLRRPWIRLRGKSSKNTRNSAWWPQFP